MAILTIPAIEKTSDLRSYGTQIERGLRNNNPMNIVKSGSKWIGLSQSQPDSKFATFTRIGYGLRAGVYLLIKSYIQAKKLNTITKILNVYAPPSENDTQSYIDSVSTQTGIRPETIIVPTRATMKKLIIAMTKLENGSAHIGLIRDTDLNVSIDNIFNELGLDMNNSLSGLPGEKKKFSLKRFFQKLFNPRS